MPTPYKMLMSRWARNRIAEAGATAHDEKKAAMDDLKQIFDEMLKFPSAQMTPDDLKMLRRLEDWTNDPDFEQRLEDRKSK
jgi:hypothetical protein